MSAEIISMSLRGVAIAADSTSTSARSDGSKKIRKATNKITSFSRNIPIAIVTQGNRDFNGIPFEILVRDFKNKNEDKSWKTVKDCHDDFLNYIGNCGLDYLNYGNAYADRVLTICFSHIEQIFEESEGNARKFKAKIKDLPGVDKSDDFLFFTSYTTNGNGDNSQLIRNSYSDRIKRWLSNDFVGSQLCTESVCKNIIEYCVHSMQEIEFAEHDDVTFALVGYGEDEYTPTYIACTIHAVVCGLTYYTEHDFVDINTHKAKAICHLTQNNFLSTFLQGIDPDFEEQLNINNGTSLDSIKKRVSKDLKELLAGTEIDSKAVNNILNKHLSSFAFDFNLIHLKQEHKQSLFRSFSGFSVDDLADISESLVKLIAFRKRMTCEDQDVGGPIDVAIITKAGGLEWKKRKQYFKRELNEHLF